jgi:peroxiredoxin
MVDDLKAWEAERPPDAPQLLVVSTGTVESNREQGIASPILLDEGFQTGRAFGASGTPSSILIDEQGRIASRVAVGGPAVLAMAKGEEAPVPTGNGGGPAPAVPKVGDKAPDVKLPDLAGKTVDLASHKGTRTLVLFWNPGCGFCRRMLDELKAWEAKPPRGAPKLLVVSTGSVEENREEGLRSPILLDQGFRVGSTFGAGGTPSAVLVDAKGNIASEVAVGAQAVMALAGAKPAEPTVINA